MHGTGGEEAEEGLFVVEGLKQMGDLGFDVGDSRVDEFGGEIRRSDWLSEDS